MHTHVLRVPAYCGMELLSGRQVKMGLTPTRGMATVHLVAPSSTVASPAFLVQALGRQLLARCNLKESHLLISLQSGLDQLLQTRV